MRGGGDSQHLGKAGGVQGDGRGPVGGDGRPRTLASDHERIADRAEFRMADRRDLPFQYDWLNAAKAGARPIAPAPLETHAKMRDLGWCGPLFFWEE